MSSSTRKEYLDILRVIAGIAVVCIHVSDPFVNLSSIFGGITWWGANIVNSYSRISVPLFVMISGALLLPTHKHIPIFEFLKKRVIRIVIPLFFWSAFYFIFWRWAYLTPEMVITAYAAGKLEHLYFLVIMLGLYMLTPVLRIIIKNAALNEYKYILGISFLFSLLLGFFHRFISSIDYEANALTIAFPYVCFFLAGHFFSSCQKKFDMKRLIVLLFTLGLLNAVINYGLTLLDKNNIRILFSNGLGQYVYEAYSPLIMIMTIILFVMVQNVVLPRKIGQVVQNISMHIFGIYLIHPLVISLLDQHLHLNVNSLHSPLWAYMMLKIVIVCVISYALVALGRKIPRVRVIFG